MLDTNTLALIGLSQEELADRVVDKLAETLITELDWDEDGVAYRKPNGLKQKLQKLVQEKVDASIKALADEHVLPHVGEMVEGLVLQRTNEWGEKAGKPVTFTEYMVGRADAYMREEVDSDGKSRAESNSGYWSKKTTRVAHMIDKHLYYRIEDAMKVALTDANKMIAGGIHEAVKTGLQNALGALKVQVAVKG